MWCSHTNEWLKFIESETWESLCIWNYFDDNALVRTSLSNQQKFLSWIGCLPWLWGNMFTLVTWWLRFDTWWSGSGTRIIVGRCGWCSSDCESTCLPWNGWGDHEWNYWIAGMKQRHPEMCPPFVLFWTKRLTALQTQFELILLLRYKFFW